jgi:hypothetical protein
MWEPPQYVYRRQYTVTPIKQPALLKDETSNTLTFYSR